MHSKMRCIAFCAQIYQPLVTILVFALPLKLAARYVEFICVLLALIIYTFALFFAFQVGCLYVLALRMY